MASFGGGDLSLLLHTEFTPETKGGVVVVVAAVVPSVDCGGIWTFELVEPPFRIPTAFFGSLTLSSSSSPAAFSLKRSDNFFFLSAGDDSGMNFEFLPKNGLLLPPPGVPVEKLWWTGVFPRDGVKSAFKEVHQCMKNQS